MYKLNLFFISLYSFLNQSIYMSYICVKCPAVGEFLQAWVVPRVQARAAAPGALQLPGVPAYHGSSCSSSYSFSSYSFSSLLFSSSSSSSSSSSYTGIPVAPVAPVADVYLFPSHRMENIRYHEIHGTLTLDIMKLNTSTMDTFF